MEGRFSREGGEELPNFTRQGAGSKPFRFFRKEKGGAISREAGAISLVDG